MKRLSLLVLALCLTLVVGISAGFAAEEKKDTTKDIPVGN